MGWATKTDATGRGHYLLADGTPACSHLRERDGSPRLSPFKTPFGPFVDHSHLCTLCRRMYPRACLCGLCKVQHHISATSVTKVHTRD